MLNRDKDFRHWGDSMSSETVLHHARKLQALAAQRSMLIAEQAERKNTGGCLREVDTAFAEYSEDILLLAIADLERLSNASD